MKSWSPAARWRAERDKLRNTIASLEAKLADAEAQKEANARRASIVANTLNRERFERARDAGVYERLPS